MDVNFTWFSIFFLKSRIFQLHLSHTVELQPTQITKNNTRENKLQHTSSHHPSIMPSVRVKQKINRYRLQYFYCVLSFAVAVNTNIHYSTSQYSKCSAVQCSKRRRRQLQKYVNRNVSNDADDDKSKEDTTPVWTKYTTTNIEMDAHCNSAVSFLVLWFTFDMS